MRRLQVEPELGGCSEPLAEQDRGLGGDGGLCFVWRDGDAYDVERVGRVTPGEVLREEFMAPLGLSGRALARELGVPSNRVAEIVAGERAIIGR